MKNILVIEEDRNFSHLLCQFLRNNNFHVIEAVNPTIGSSLVRDQYPDLVICSFESLAFDRTKCQTAQEIRYAFSSVKIPWILLTAETSIFDLSGKIILSEVTILRKPVALHIILNIVHSEITQSEQERIADVNRSVLNHHYYFNELEPLLNHGLRSTNAKLRGSAKTSKTFTFLSRRCNLSIEQLDRHLKAKRNRQ